MGVKDLWIVASPIGEVEVLSSLSGHVLAIDLSCWICDSQKAKMGGSVIRPHLRNLFFRTTTLLSYGIIPVFVIEGEAPKLKIETMQKRSQQQFAQCKRTRLKGFLSQCCKLLDLLGIPWIQAKGEGEATCALLNHFGIADAVVTQDSDAFLYGGKCVLRNFSANKQKATFDKFTLDKLEKTFRLNRDTMIVMALLLGCDYLPGGIAGVGKEAFLQLIQHWHSIGVKDSIKRFREWKNMKSSTLEKGKRNIEDTIRLKTVVHPDFPFDDVIAEFHQKMEKPNLTVRWEKPNFKELVEFLTNMLDWEVAYCIEKCTPLLTTWMVNNHRKASNIQVERVVKKRVHHGVPSLEVEWNLLDDFSNLGLNQQDPIKTIEPAVKFAITFPDQVSQFEERISNAKKAKKAIRPKTKTKVKKVPVTKKIDEYFTKKDTSLDQFDDDSIDESDLSAVIDRLVNLKMADSCKPTKTDETICISDSESENSKGQSAFDHSSFCDDLFADDGKSSASNTSPSNGTSSSIISSGKTSPVLNTPTISDKSLNDFLDMNKTPTSHTNSDLRAVTTRDKPCFQLFDSPYFLSSSRLGEAINQTPMMSRDTGEAANRSPMKSRDHQKSTNRTPVKSHDLPKSTNQISVKSRDLQKSTNQTPVKSCDLQDSSFDSPELSLMQRMCHKYGTKSVNQLLSHK